MCTFYFWHKCEMINVWALSRQYFFAQYEITNERKKIIYIWIKEKHVSLPVFFSTHHTQYQRNVCICDRAVKWFFIVQKWTTNKKQRTHIDNCSLSWPRDGQFHLRFGSRTLKHLHFDNSNRNFSLSLLTCFVIFIVVCMRSI